MKLLALAALAAAVWLLLRRRRRRLARVTVGWTDGSELELESGPARDRLVAIAAGAFA